MADEMENDYMQRGYLLPHGCKDLIDVLRLQSLLGSTVLKNSIQSPQPLGTGEITVPAQMTVEELAALLVQKPFRIIADLMEIGVFANVKQPVDFDAISQVAWKYGYTAKKAT